MVQFFMMAYYGVGFDTLDKRFMKVVKYSVLNPENMLFSKSYMAIRKSKPVRHQKRSLFY